MTAHQAVSRSDVGALHSDITLGLEHFVELTAQGHVEDELGDGTMTSLRVRRSDVGALYVGRGRALRQDLWLEHLTERVTELTAHGAVQDEVYGTVQQSQDVHELAQLVVAVPEEAVAEDAAEEAEHALRHLGDQEQ